MDVKTLVYPRYLPPDQVFASLEAPSLTFLDSAPEGHPAGRWSLIGIRPWQTLTAWPGRVEISGRKVKGEPLQILARLLDACQSDGQPGLPMSGGAMGAIAYEYGLSLLQLSPLWPSDLPWLSFHFYDRFFLFDRQQKTLHLQACGQTQPAEAALGDMQAFLDALGSPPPMPRPQGKILSVPHAKPYQEAVQTIRRAIEDGEFYIANYTGRVRAISDQDGSKLFLPMQEQNPAPFAAYLRQGDLELLSSSPERFLKVEREGPERVVTTCPIKGTRPRRLDPEADKAMRRELLASQKDRSELLMIVDLERNDLSRVCRPDSVRVENLFAVESYPTVHHLVATVRGVLEEDHDAVAALKACFPGGSISGAPKRQAARWLQELEKEPRGYYTGCLGYLSADGQADFSILIRTLQKEGDQIVYGAGGGITYESDPQAEHQEMLDKTEALRRLWEGGSHD